MQLHSFFTLLWTSKNNIGCTIHGQLCVQKWLGKLIVTRETPSSNITFTAELLGSFKQPNLSVSAPFRNMGNNIIGLPCKV